MVQYLKSRQRDRFIQAIKIGTITDYKLFGWGVTDTGIEYESDEETKRFVTQKNGFTENKGYTLSSSVEQEVYVDDPLFPVIDNIRRRLLIGEGARGQMLNCNLYMQEAEQPATCTGEEFDISITINSFAGPAEDPLSISYTINYQGSPKIGNVALTYGEDEITFAFTPETPVGE